MLILIAGLVVFFAAHYFTAVARSARDGLAQRLGEGPYKGAFALVSLAGFALIILGWRSADASLVYSPPAFLRHATLALMPFATILIVAAYAPAGRIAAAAKHPMLAAVKIWAFAHLLSNGELRSVLLFGAFLVFAVVDRIALKRRGAATPTPGPILNDGIAVVAGLAVYAAIYLWAHRWIAGVPLS